MEESFTAQMPLLMATSTFELGVKMFEFSSVVLLYYTTCMHFAEISCKIRELQQLCFVKYTKFKASQN